MRVVRIGLDDFIGAMTARSNPAEQMRESVAIWRSARLAYAGRLVYAAILISFTLALAVFAMATHQTFPVPLLVCQTLLTGFMIGALPWRNMRNDASRSELWFAMSFPIVHLASEKAQGIEGIMLRNLVETTIDRLALAPRNRKVRMDHLSQIADAMQQSRDVEVRMLLASHVQLMAIAMGAKPIREEASRP